MDGGLAGLGVPTPATLDGLVSIPTGLMGPWETLNVAENN